MIGKKNIIKIAHAFVRRGQRIPDGRTMHPARDWFIGLWVSSFLFITGAVYAGFDFVHKIQSIDRRPSSHSSIVVYKQKDAAEILTRYESRALQFETLRNTAHGSFSGKNEFIVEPDIETLADERIEQ